MTVAIHQMVAGFAPGDAISNEARAMARLFAAWGHPGSIYAEARRVAAPVRDGVRELELAHREVRPQDVTILHLSSGSAVNPAFATLPGRKLVRYHNITPERYFQGINETVARTLRLGRAQARALAPGGDLNLADSRFNAEELAEWGFHTPQVLPLVLDFTLLRGAVCEGTRRRWRDDDGVANVLFVGRCVPNKRFEDLLLAFACFQRFVRPRARLLLVGAVAGMERYYHWLRLRARDLGIEEVRFTGPLSQAELNATYRAADLFLCLSEHEGFCIPLLESMVFDVPVIAYAAGAVPDTLDGAGVLLARKDPRLIAETMGRVLDDATLRAAIVAGQRRRLAAYESRDVAGELRRLLDPFLKGG